MIGVGAAIKAIVYLVIVVSDCRWSVVCYRSQRKSCHFRMNNQKLQDNIKEQQELMEQMQNDIEQIQTINKDLQEQNIKQKQDVDNLSRKFDKRDFGVFAIDNTEKAEYLINRGTKNALRCLELASGAPLNETEKNAKSPVEANRECPSLVDPSFKPILN
jgi:TolA-binding protein